MSPLHLATASCPKGPSTATSSWVLGTRRVFTRKAGRMLCRCSVTGPPSSEMAGPWRPPQAITAAPCKPETRTRLLQGSLSLALVGLPRFTSTVTSGNRLPNETELRSTDNTRRTGARPTSPWGIAADSGSTGTMSKHHTAPAHPHLALGPSPRDLAIHNTRSRRARSHRLWHLQLGF